MSKRLLYVSACNQEDDHTQLVAERPVLALVSNQLPKLSDIRANMKGVSLSGHSDYSLEDALRCQCDKGKSSNSCLNPTLTDSQVRMQEMRPMTELSCGTVLGLVS